MNETVDTDAARRARLERVEALLQAALWYVGRGISVFPLKPGEKVPATRHGFKDATTDPEQVRAWWADTPAYNIGLPTGHMFDVIDIDGPPGYASLLEVRERELIPEQLLGKAITPRGCHLYVPATGDGNAAGLWPGIDYRGKSGYCVAPPSRSINGMWLWCDPPTT